VRRSAEAARRRLRAPGAGALHIHLFGRLRIERDGRPLPGLNCAKARELLAYLLLHRQRSHRREDIAERLWGDAASAEPRKTLRQALWQLQSVLAECCPDLLEADGGDWIRVEPQASVWLDVAVFESAWLQLETSPGREATPASAARAKEALGLYRGELLEGSSWSWCVFERARLRELFLSLGDLAMSGCLAASERAEGVRLGFDILRHDPAREGTHRSLMRLHALAGDRTAALRQFDRCVAALREELGVPPSRRTRELAESIRTDGLDGGRLGAGVAEVPVAGLPVASVLEGLREVRDLLNEVRREVHCEIRALEKAIDAPAIAESPVAWPPHSSSLKR
jgi:DNA-binding SARP family transcriptional activator